MLARAKILFVSSALFLLSVFLVPFFVSADSASTLQVINAGTLSFLQTPSNFSFDSLPTSRSEQVSTSIPETGSSSTGDLVVQDLRFSGGFSVSLQATTFSDGGSNSFDCSDLGFLTFTAGADDVDESENIIPQTPAVTASYDGDPNSSQAYTAMTLDSGSNCQAVEILSGSANDEQGRIGTWTVYPAYELTIPAFAVPGTYTSTFTFTLSDDTTSSSVFGSTVSISGSSPADSGTVIAENESGAQSYQLSFTLPSYSGDGTVNAYVDVCSDVGMLTCATATTDTNIYSATSAGQTYNIEVSENELYDAAATSLSMNDGSTVYTRFRLVDQGTGSESTIATNSRTYTMDITVFGGDNWDSGDDTGAGATSLSMTSSTQTHGAHTLSSNDNYDWFSMSLTSGRDYVLTATSGSGDTYGELYSDSGGSTLVASNDDGGEGSMFSISYTAASTATYYLRVRCFSIGSDCGYTLSYREDDGSIGSGSSGGVTWTGYDINSTDYVFDMVIDSSQRIHALSQDLNLSDLIYNYYDGSSWTRTTLDTDLQDFAYAKIALDSTGKPGVAWLEYDAPTSSAIYYKKFNGSTWDSTITVDSGLRAQPGGVGFDFMKSGGDSDYPRLLSCQSDADVVEYIWNGSAFGSAQTIVSDGGGAQCRNLDMVIFEDDTGGAVTVGGNNVEYLTYNGSSWTLTDDNIGSLSINSSDVRFLYDDNDVPVFLFYDTSSNNIYFGKKSAGSWSTSVIDNLDINGVVGMTIQEPLVANAIWISYLDPSTDTLTYKYTSDLGANWTTGTVSLDVYGASTSWTAMAWDNANTNDTISILTSGINASNTSQADFNRYILSELP